MRNLLIVASMLSIGSAAFAQPLIYAYKTEQPPKLDGDLSDACWQEANVTSPFVSSTKAGLPDQQTQVRLCWDESNLYAGVEAFDAYLEPAMNMLHAVRAEQNGRDARVFSDDCIELFLQPEGTTYYHFAANSGTGTLEKTSTDRDWDTDWDCVAHRGTESYVVEIAIPFAAMKAEPKGVWRVNFARERTAITEFSTWSGLQGEFHQPEAFGRLGFAESGPALSSVELETLEREHKLNAVVRGAANAQSVLQLNLTAGGQEVSETARGPGEHTLTVQVPDEAFETGEFEVTYALRQEDQEVVRSAAIPVRIAAATVKLDLSSRNAETRAFLRGKPVKTGGEAILKLHHGLNFLAIEASATGDGARIRPELSSSGHPIAPRWLSSSEVSGSKWRESLPEEGWNPARSYDDGLWALEQSKSAYFLCALYVGQRGPQLFPRLDTYYFPRNSEQLIRVYQHTPLGVPMDDYRMIVEVPAFLDYVAAEPVSGGEPKVARAGTFTDGDVEMARYHVTYDDMVPHQAIGINLAWRDEYGGPVFNQPSISTGGTHDWQHGRMTVTAQPGVSSVSLAITKWANRGITGTAWVDNVVFREKGSEENLLETGSFDEPVWADDAQIKPEGPDGSMCAKIVSTPDMADRGQAVWFGGRKAIGVEEGKQYVVELDAKCENMGSEQVMPIVGLLFRAPADVKDQKLPIYTYFESLNGTITELPQRSHLVVLPPLKDVQPKEARITPCYYYQRLYNPDVVKAYADNCWASGMTWVFGRRTNNLVPHLLPRGLHVWWVISWDEYSYRYVRYGNVAPPGLREFFENHPEVQAIDFDGKRKKRMFCPSWLLTEGDWAMRELGKRIVRTLNSYPLHAADLDLELGVIEPPTFCTCDRCLAAFREFANLPEHEPLSPKILLEKYPEEWTNFRCSQNAEMAGRLANIVHRADRPVEFSLYSGFQSQRTKEHYGVDWKLMASKIDIGIAGYNGNLKRITDTVKALGDTPFMPTERWYRRHDVDTGPATRMETWRNRLLRSYVNGGCTGVLFWQLASMDGGGFYATSEATEIIATYEDFFKRQQRCDEKVEVSGVELGNWAAFEKDGRTLVLLMNFQDETIKASVSIAGKSYAKQIEPYDVAVLLTQ